MTSSLVNNLGRIQLIHGSPPALPGKCVVCGAVQCDNGFVDTGWEIDFYGVVYFCANCIREVLAVVGFLPVDSFKELTRRLLEQRAKVEALQIENEELRRGLDSLASIGWGTISGSDSDSSGDSIDEIESESVKEPEPVNSKPTDRKTRSTKQTNESGHSDVRDDDSIKQIFDI